MYNHIGIKSHTRQQAVRCSMLQDDGTVPLQWLSQPPLEWSRTPGSSQDSPSPCMGDTGALHQTDKKGNVSIRRKLGRSKATGEGAPGGVSICSQLTGASHPNSLLGAVTRLALCYIQTSSPLTMLIWEHHPAGAPQAWGPSACITTVPQALPAPPRQRILQPSSTITNPW